MTSNPAPNKDETKFKFNEKQVIALIEAIKKRKGIWVTSAKGRQHHELYQEVLDELNIEGLQLCDIRKRWSYLRNQFLTTSKALDNEVLGHGGALDREVPWVYYDHLVFLFDRNEDEESSYSIPDSPDQAEAEAEAETTADYEFDPMLLIPQIEIADSDVNVSQSLIPLTPPLGNVSSTGFHQNESMINTWNANLLKNDGTSTPRCLGYGKGTATARMSDPTINRAFCSLLLSELQAVPQEKSQSLRTMLMQAKDKFMKEIRE